MTEAYEHAKKIVVQLAKAGHLAYFAGGWVRDFLMGHPSEDIDIATDAPPVKIMDLFPQTVLVGLAFGVVIVTIEGHQFEVATFRKDLPYLDGRHPQGIELSNPHEDACRRDFTINGMFYDPLEEKIHDFVHGQEDIRHKIIRTIGNPYDRFFEDRLRMLRAFRFASRFSFNIDLETQEAIKENADKLFPSVAMERVWQEFNKMASYPRFDDAIVSMHRLGLLTVIFPELNHAHINDMRHEVKIFSHFPKNTPTILYLMELFPHLSLEKKIDMIKRLKASNQDVKLVEFMDKVKQAVEMEENGNSPGRHAWVSLFAHPNCELCLNILSARIEEGEKNNFLKRYRSLYQQLSPHIFRMQKNQPLVSSTHLKNLGIPPGKKMGILLKEAEKIAINEHLDNPEEILLKLRHLPIWNTFDG